jgi:hypothetical protein
MIQFETDTRHRSRCNLNADVRRQQMCSAKAIRHYDERSPTLVDSSETELLEGEISRQAGDIIVTSRIVRKRFCLKTCTASCDSIEWEYGHVLKKVPSDAIHGDRLTVCASMTAHDTSVGSLWMIERARSQTAPTEEARGLPEQPSLRYPSA